MTVSHGRFGGFLLHRSALQRRISTGFTSGLSGPRSLVLGRAEFMTKNSEKQALYPRSEVPGLYGPIPVSQ
jgi:hypothetical protein